MGRMLIKLSIMWVTIALIQMHGYKGCLEKERIALLEIKAFFKSVSTWQKHRILTSWVDDRMSDCCGWERVRCNATTRRVSKLFLNYTRGFNWRDENISDGYPILDLSLFNHFDELQSLDLSDNSFEGWDGNKDDYGNLTQLKELDLSLNWFNSSLLSYLSGFISLRSLILHDNWMEVNKPEQGLKNLKNLERLDLSRNRLNIPLTWLGLQNLKNLKMLKLAENEINSSLTRLGLKNLKNLEMLDLSGNYELSGSLTGLKNLKNLKMLNLAGNGINSSLTRLGLKNLKNLEMLDLSDNDGLSGSLTGICELKNLVELNLMYSEIHGDLPDCLNNLTHLRLLDLSSNELSGNFSSVIATLTSLEYLSLSNNNFEGLFSFSSLANLSKLEVFLLSTQNNLLQVETETQLPINQLKVLTLANCISHGSTFGFLLNQYNLRLIDLSSNKLAGKFPTWLLQNNTKLETMLLMNNSFTGILQLPSSEHGLVRLDISNNNFTDQLPDNIGKILPRLKFLKMSENGFEGNIPSSVGEMKSLDYLDLSSNNFSGELPSYFLTGCFSLQTLILSENNFQGKILPEFMNWTQLIFLYLDDNQFSGELEDGLLKATNLRILEISNNKIHGQVPQWIGNFSGLQALLMQKNFLEGNAIQLSNLKSYTLDISENRLSGPITSSFDPSISILHMQKNALNGTIPISLFKNSILRILDLRDNEFSGIPQGIDDHSILHSVLLGGNHLQGHIPNQLCQLKNLKFLDLSYNRLSGSIPSCFANMLSWKVGNESDVLRSARLMEGLSSISMDVYYNSSLHMEELLGSYDSFSAPVELELLTKNRYDIYKGYILEEMTGLDLSSNKLTGDIPSEIGDLQGIYSLNLSNNSLSGSIPKSFSNLRQIESLDLSYNKLIGQIPPQLTGLYNLAIFNVSYNNLSGSIPNTWQFGSFEESTYVGNPYLCGPPIKKMCTNTVEQPTSSNAEEEGGGDSAIDMVSFYWSFAASYVTIILVLIVILWMNSHWRRLWFYFIDKCISFSF